MRFSAATMAILALSADWATAARINGVIGEELEYQLTKNRELYPKASKKAKAAFSCGISGTSSKSSKKATSDDDSCDTPTSVLTCGKTYTGTVTLTTGLVCTGADESPTFGIIMDGHDAVLNCAGNDVVVDADDVVVVDSVLVYPAAIVLRNGATAMNCQVHSGEGNGVGVWMDEGDATLIDSHIYNKYHGVYILGGDGCRTLTNVRTSGNGNAGVVIRDAAGTIVMTNLEANGNVNFGVVVVPEELPTLNLNLVMDGAKLNSNGFFGLVVSNQGNGNIDVELFGTVRAIGNDGTVRAIGNVGYGIGAGGPSTWTVNGKLQASSNTVNGIYLEGDESELVIAESGTVIACGNGEEDIAVVDANEVPVADPTTQINDEDGLLISDSDIGFEEGACAASAPPNQVAECELE